mgnify:FL=1
MNKTLEKLNENKVVISILLSAFILGFFIYFTFSSSDKLITSNVIKNVDIIEGKKLVTKIIDGDTVIIEGGFSIRLPGIDSDEKSYPCYTSAKERIEELVLNKEVYLEADKEDQDQYKRYLRYLILDGENINLKLVKEGLAIARFSPDNIKYKEEISNAEKEARENKIGCKWGETFTAQPTELPKVVGSDAISACNAGNYIGKEKIIAGKVADSYKSKTNTVFLNFEKPYPNHCFTAVIFSSDLINFPENPQNYYGEKLIRVNGVIKEYQGKPEIILEDRSQIEVIT